MVLRHLSKVIKSRLKKYPAVVILGPRQIGKTTLSKTFSNQYYDLELEEDILRLDIQWNDITQASDIIILDEAQNYPDIFYKLRNEIDKDRKKNGRFLVLGSVSPALMTSVSEFLTGRISLCELTPFSILELQNIEIDNLWLMGGYPDGGILDRDYFPQWQKDYLNLMAMRDLPQWGLTSKPQMTLRLFKMLASLHGAIWNASSVGKSLGISYHTVNTYLEFLEQVFLIRRIQPYYANIKKRLVKSPKIYWRDSGLLHNINSVSSFEQLLNQPWVGYSWEGWIIEQLLIFLNNKSISFDGPYFMRTREGYEVDLILNISQQLWAIEIKLTSSPGKTDKDRLTKSAQMINADKMVLISRINDSVFSTNFISSNLIDFLKYWDKILK